MASVQSLQATELYTRCDPEQFDFETTADLDDFNEIVGQNRAVEAVQFGIGIQKQGYNIFALGTSGTGKHTMVQRFLEQQAANEPPPPDWCYVYNFDEKHKPVALELPAGTGRQLRQDMERLVEDLRTSIPAAFETDEYRVRRRSIEEEFGERQEKAFSDIQEKAQAKGLTLLRTPAGLVFAPVKEGEVISPEEFQKLSEEEQKTLESEVETLQAELQEVLQQMPGWERELRRRLRELNQEVAQFAIEPLLDELRKKYEDLSPIVDYLNAVQQDILENLNDLLRDDAQKQAGQAPGQTSDDGMTPNLPRPSLMDRYAVNLLVDQTDTEGAPVIYEDNPAYQNLVGRIEYMARMGALLTDFSLIKAGALHRANGGYLMLDARKLLMQPFAWEGLKRALRAQQIRIETPGQMLSQVSTVTLEPESIPLDVKVALVGDRMLYYLLSDADPEFDELFKVAADFNDDMDRDEEAQLRYARLLASIVRREELRPLGREAVALVIEQSARMAGDAKKLSSRMVPVSDLLQEADYWAEQAGAEVIQRSHVQQALDAQRYRSNRMQERSQEAIVQGTIHIETEGTTVGQVNGLAVLQLGKIAFGRPNRITARVQIGRGEVIDIEREVALGGAIHSKGVMILASFLGARYAIDYPLSLSASLVFEQSYSGVEGDSASSAELYALLSAISEIPIKQSFAVTGSVDQRGNVQAIGGVNEKIEGFFEICNAQGLTGEQGVLIPQTNVRHLMLRDEVVDAVEAGKFHIYPVETIDQGIELLTGLPAGERDEEGHYPEGSVNQRVQARLLKFARRRLAFHRTPDGDLSEGEELW